ncbi:hypothetical protein B4113_2838 [Geobacillus sp. B4113_201601]|nr:hypothetical protein B4113_2838 [Geobacillus sp. B4113_201601]
MRLSPFVRGFSFGFWEMALVEKGECLPRPLVYIFHIGTFIVFVFFIYEIICYINFEHSE